MHPEDYRTLQIRGRGPLFGAQEYLSFSTVESAAACDEGKALLKEARESVDHAISRVSLLVSYVARMNGIEE